MLASFICSENKTIVIEKDEQFKEVFVLIDRNDFVFGNGEFKNSSRKFFYIHEKKVLNKNEFNNLINTVYKIQSNTNYIFKYDEKLVEKKLNFVDFKLYPLKLNSLINEMTILYDTTFIHIQETLHQNKYTFKDTTEFNYSYGKVLVTKEFYNNYLKFNKTRGFTIYGM